MSDLSTISGSPAPEPNTYNPVAHVALRVGTAVTPLAFPGGEVTLADASQIIRAPCAGLVVTPGSAGHRVNVRYAGPVTLTTEEWDLVTGGDGGLQSGPYYVSDAVPGRITFSRPTAPGHFVTQVGLALSSTDFLVQVGPTAQIT